MIRTGYYLLWAATRMIFRVPKGNHRQQLLYGEKKKQCSALIYTEVEGSPHCGSHSDPFINRSYSLIGRSRKQDMAKNHPLEPNKINQVVWLLDQRKKKTAKRSTMPHRLYDVHVYLKSWHSAQLFLLRPNPSVPHVASVVFFWFHVYISIQNVLLYYQKFYTALHFLSSLCYSCIFIIIKQAIRKGKIEEVWLFWFSQ